MKFSNIVRTPDPDPENPPENRPITRRPAHATPRIPSHGDIFADMNTSSPHKNGISGKKIVPLVYGTAVLLCAGLLWYGLNYRKTHVVSPPLPAEDRAHLAELPPEWTRITNVEGQGWVIFVPCSEEAGTLRIEAEAENPRLLCSHCDTITEATVRRVTLKGKPVKVRLKLGVMGTAWVEPVDAAVAARFPGAVLPDYVLTWTLDDGAELFFIPSQMTQSFETLRAADESPEGCLGE
jgi:hypothetical protein